MIIPSAVTVQVQSGLFEKHGNGDVVFVEVWYAVTGPCSAASPVPKGGEPRLLPQARMAIDVPNCAGLNITWGMDHWAAPQSVDMLRAAQFCRPEQPTVRGGLQWTK